MLARRVHSGGRQHAARRQIVKARGQLRLLAGLRAALLPSFMSDLMKQPNAARQPQATAVEMARALAKRPGLVFLDSAVPDQDGRSVIASEPVEIIEGCIWSDAGKLREVLHKNCQDQPGGLFGHVSFDGKFLFGVYPQCTVFDGKGKAGSPPHGGEQIQFTPLMSEAEFVRITRRAKEYIAAGDIYQVNLSYPWIAEWPRDLEPFNFYERLRCASPAPHAAYLDLGGTQIFSASPECFLKINGRKIVSRPIKGTRPRGSDGESDRRLSAELAGSEKERAELVMITDLERNDLGQVCEFGSVQVRDLLRLEQHAQVHHLVSTVEGTLRKDVDHLAAFIACFPGGSISGAPKKRALEIIQELEPHPRDIYTGAIGWFGFHGESQFSIAIRTAWKNGNSVRFHTGAGIVADSVPELEYEETRHKAAGILKAAGS